MIASLPMYDRPETTEANDKLWQLIRAQLPPKAPARLTRDIPDLIAHWTAPDLTLSQTCGFPYRAVLASKVNLVASPVLNLECPPGYYYSVIIAHRDHEGARLERFDGARAAYNDPMSQSGWAALHAHMAVAGFSIGPRAATGAHVASAQAVALGQADFAAIDALTWQMICKWDAFAADLCVIAQTAPTPTLPYICASGLDGDIPRQALEHAIAALDDTDAAALGLRGVTQIPPKAYLSVPIPPAPNE